MNFYETASFVGYLLDLIYQTRKLEEIRIKLVYSSQQFNLFDAWLFVQPTAYSQNAGRIS